MTEKTESYTNMFGINVIHKLAHALNYPGRLFAKQTSYGNVWYGLIFMGVLGLLIGGAMFYLGVH